MKELVKRVIDVKFVNDRPKYPKFSAGSVKLTDESWLSVAKNIDIKQFHEGIFTVEVETNDKGYETIVNVVPDVTISGLNVTNLTGNTGQTVRVEHKGRDYEAEARGKVACAAFAAALASPGIAALDGDYLTNVKSFADAMVSYTWERQKQN